MYVLGIIGGLCVAVGVLLIIIGFAIMKEVTSQNRANTETYQRMHTVFLHTSNGWGSTMTNAERREAIADLDREREILLPQPKSGLHTTEKIFYVGVGLVFVGLLCSGISIAHWLAH